MKTTTSSLAEFITEIQPFNTLPEEALNQLVEQLEPVHYRLGEKLLLPNRIPTHILIVYRGQVRLLGYDVRRETEVTLEKLESQSLVGANSLVRQVYRASAIASTDVDCLALPREIFESLLKQHSHLATYFYHQISLSEIFEVLGAELNRQADGTTDLKQLAIRARAQAVVCYFPPNKPAELDLSWRWYVSGGKLPEEIEVNSYFQPENLNLAPPSSSIRLLGLPESIFSLTASSLPLAITNQTIQFNSASQRITSFLLNRRWNDWVCALTTVALLSLNFWTNSSPLKQASPSLQPTVFSDSLLLD